MMRDSPNPKAREHTRVYTHTHMQHGVLVKYPGPGDLGLLHLTLYL